MPLDFPVSPTEFCVTDVGSTTTKAVLFQKSSSGWRIHREEASTTVERPHEDVTVGIANAFRALERVSGVELLKNGVPSVPYLSTSSAGGGLAMVVTGLVRDVTSRSAESVALGAGAILLDVIAMDDGRTPYEKIQALRDLRPDMILLAGGFDGDAISGPVFLSELIRESDLKPKLSLSAKLPVVFAGNANAARLARDTLGENFLFHPVDNIRPSGDKENLEPAREALHEFFMNHVMSHAPGYETLISWVGAPILPTPSAFGKILAHASRELGLRILAIDIGGATTDVFTADSGEVVRTVSANLGMSYSIMNVVQRSGMGVVDVLLGSRNQERGLWDTVGNKYIQPTGLPKTEDEMHVEWAIGAVAIREAVKDHRLVLDGVPLSRDKEELTIRHGQFSGSRQKKHEERRLSHAEGYDLIIGSGGILSHSPRRASAMMLINALNPRSPVSLAVDSAFVFPHLGVLSETVPDLSLQLFQELGLVRLGSVMPVGIGGKRPGDTFHVRGITDDGRAIEERVSPGEVKSIPLESHEEAQTEIGGPGLVHRRHRARLSGGVCGLIVDARGMGIDPEDSQPRDETGLLIEDRVDPPTCGRGIQGKEIVRKGPILVRRELAVPGQVFVEPGEEVEAHHVIARSSRRFLRPFFLDVAASLKVEPNQLDAHLIKNIGDEIFPGDIIAKRKIAKIASKTFVSPIAGRIERILPTGMLIVREKSEEAIQLGTATVAKDLRVRPEHIKPYIRVSEGQLVEKGQPVAVMMRPGDMRYCRSPMRGKVREINHRYGIIHIEPFLEELEIRAWMPGQVGEVTDQGCVIENDGVDIEGVWGIGGEVSGQLSLRDVGPGLISVREAATKEDLAIVASENGTGLLVGSLHLKDVLDLDPVFTIVLTTGFGDAPMESGLLRIFENFDGKLVLLDGTTEMRVGVKRPRVILPNKS